MKKFDAPEMELVLISAQVSMLNESNGDPDGNSNNAVSWPTP